MDIYNYIYNSWKTTEYDPRTTDWFLVRHEWTVYVMFGAYLYFVLQCGPKYMENRRPYGLKTFIKFYNIFQIFYNAWIVYACIKNGLFRDFGLGCEFVDKSETGRPMELVNTFYWTTLLKIIDLTETVVFVLRKKYRQISFLHLYHHISTIYLGILSLKYYPGGMATFPLVLNSGIHVVMYSYYLLSTQGPTIQRIINPFKPYITIMQMVQFFILLAYTLQAFVPGCDVPKWGAIIMFFNLIMNFILFYNFYRQNYKNKPKPKKS